MCHAEMQWLKVDTTKGKAKKAKFFDCPSTMEYMLYLLNRIAADSEGMSATPIVVDSCGETLDTAGYSVSRPMSCISGLICNNT